MENTEETTAIQPAEEQPRSRDTTATRNAQPLYQPSDDDKLYRLLFGQGDFTPTANMCRLVIEFIAQPEDLSPMQILKKQGHAKQNWYQWQQSHPGFLQWWNAVIEDVIRDEHLSGLYLQLLKRARTHDTGAAKLLMQRFDIKYTERTQQDIRGVFAGYEPAAADDSRERQRKALVNQGQSLPVVQGDARDMPLLPSNGGVKMDMPRVNACDHNTHTEPVTGVCQVYGGFAPAIHAQSHDEQHEPGMDGQADNDKTLDSEPITKIDPPPRPFEE